MSAKSPPLWRIEIVTDAAVQAALCEAIEEQCAALSAFEISPGGAWRVEGLTLAKPDGAALQAQLALVAAGLGLPAPRATVEKLPDIDWLARNRRAFPPLRVGRYFVYGSHYAGGIPAGARPIRLDASIAFGSGEHATTRGCLLAIDRLTRRRRVRRALDLGCGSAILSLAVARSSSARVLAADNDPGSVRLARENARNNGVPPSRLNVVLSDGFARLPRGRRYDLVCANILARPLRRLSRDLAAAVAPGGALILSGLLAAQAADIAAAYRAQRLALRARLGIDGWRTLVMQRPL